MLVMLDILSISGTMEGSVQKTHVSMHCCWISIWCQLTSCYAVQGPMLDLEFDIFQNEDKSTLI